MEALVNTVNTVGVMGKGIALQFKRAFPENFRAYAAACERHEVVLGTMFVHPLAGLVNPKVIVNFPTKGHWRSRSRLQDIETGLADLRRTIVELGVRSIAIPPLGCGNGGLNWEDVQPLIVGALADVEGVDIHLYQPSGAPDASAMPVNTIRPTMNRDNAAMLLAFEHYSAKSAAAGLSLDGKLSLMEAQKVVYFLQLSGWPSGIDFVPSFYGPYAQSVNQFVSDVEGHFIVGFGDGTGGSKATISLHADALAEAHELLDGDAEFRRVLRDFSRTVAGYEFPYGMELLSTVHFAATHLSDTAGPGPAGVMHAIRAWSARKARLFRSEQAARAYEHLALLRAF